MAEYIDRRKAIGILEEIKESYHKAMSVDKESTAHRCMVAVSMITPADVAPVVHAHYDGGCCSNCGWPIATDCWGGGMDENNYCYHCGAKMDL